MQGCVGQGQPAERSTDLINMRRVTRRFGSDSLKKMAKVSGDSDSREGLDLSIKEMDLPIKFSDKNELSMLFDKDIVSGDLSSQGLDDSSTTTFLSNELYTPDLDLKDFFAKLSALSDRSSRRCTQEVSLGVFLEKKTVKKRKISQ